MRDSQAGSLTLKEALQGTLDATAAEVGEEAHEVAEIDNSDLSGPEAS